MILAARFCIVESAQRPELEEHNTHNNKRNSGQHNVQVAAMLSLAIASCLTALAQKK